MSASILSRKDHGCRPPFCLNTNTVISFLEGASTPRCRPCRVPSWVRNWWGFFFAVIGAVTRLPVDRLLTRRRRPRLSPFFPRRGVAALRRGPAPPLLAAGRRGGRRRRSRRGNPFLAHGEIHLR